jgi:hypothetical protein
MSRKSVIEINIRFLSLEAMMKMNAAISARTAMSRRIQLIFLQMGFSAQDRFSSR